MGFYWFWVDNSYGGTIPALKHHSCLWSGYLFNISHCITTCVRNYEGPNCIHQYHLGVCNGDHNFTTRTLETCVHHICTTRGLLLRLTMGESFISLTCKTTGYLFYRVHTMFGVSTRTCTCRREETEVPAYGLRHFGRGIRGVIL